MTRVLIDTSVWSEVLRRKPEHSPGVRETLIELVDAHRAVLMGLVRQELLSGIRKEEDFKELRAKLRAFPDEEIRTEDYETAAEYFNRCRAKGVQGSFTDFLICAVAVNHELAIFTMDKDFVQYSKILPIDLHSPAR
ncbi:MAG: PIN domain-containing protein [Leptospirales bacterium]|nr:PIN domain-containing protein [Leptospirales bacterium]